MHRELLILLITWPQDGEKW